MLDESTNGTIEEKKSESLKALSEILLNKPEFNGEKILVVIKDIGEIFGEKLRRDRSHYIDHLIATLKYTGSILGENDMDEDGIIIALLHDIHEEDRERASIDILKEKYGGKIAIAIDILSKEAKVLGENGEQNDYENIKRNSKYFERFKDLNQLEIEVRNRAKQRNINIEDEEIKKLARIIAVVKIADRVHNLSTETNESKIKETMDYFTKLAAELGGRAKKYIYLALWGFQCKLIIEAAKNGMNRQMNPSTG